MSFEHTRISFEDTGLFDPIFLDYINEKEELADFYAYKPSAESFEWKMEKKKFSRQNRENLAKVLFAQYEGIDITDKVGANIELLKSEKIFTITTGHQLCLFTGPLYFIYKIVTVIQLAKKLNKKYPDQHFVPVYWMATEDHDYAEINHFKLFGKTYQWDVSTEGPVGKLPTTGLAKLFKELPEALPAFEEAYLNSANLAEATRKLVNNLFGEEGLLVLDPDDQSLKAEFKPYIKDELLKNHSGELVEASSKKLDKLGYKTQVYPRDINLFYMEGDRRERIEREGKGFKLVDSGREFTEDALLDEVTNSPEKFSPNVVLRPLYQEVILPNGAYVGGPAELAYWLQLKSVFDFYKVDFPVLFPRLHGLVVDKNLSKKIKKLHLEAADLFQSLKSLKEKVTSTIEGDVIDLGESKGGMSAIFEELRNEASMIDPSLVNMVNAEEQKALKVLDTMEAKLEKARERKHETEMKQIEQLKEKLFPGGNGLQERTDNFLNFYINDDAFIQKVEALADPFVFEFNIFQYEE